MGQDDRRAAEDQIPRDGAPATRRIPGWGGVQYAADQPVASPAAGWVARAGGS